MSLRPKRRKCRCCSEFFFPDYRNRDRQRYCGKPACRHARKLASQRRCLSKPENWDYFRGPENVQRVQQWRQENPGCCRRQGRKPRRTLQEACSEQVAVLQKLIPKQARPELANPGPGGGSAWEP